MVKVQTSRCL